MYRSKVENPG